MFQACEIRTRGQIVHSALLAFAYMNSFIDKLLVRFAGMLARRGSGETWAIMTP